jgi:hypothetical protein
LPWEKSEHAKPSQTKREGTSRNRTQGRSERAGPVMPKTTRAKIQDGRPVHEGNHERAVPPVFGVEKTWNGRNENSGEASAREQTRRMYPVRRPRLNSRREIRSGKHNPPQWPERQSRRNISKGKNESKAGQNTMQNLSRLSTNPHEGAPPRQMLRDSDKSAQKIR